MWKLLCWAASAATLIFAAHAADTAAAKKQVSQTAVHKAPAQARAAQGKTPAAKTSTSKTGAPHPTTRTTASKTAASRTAASKAGTTRRTSTVAARRPVTTWRNRQAAPSPDRYREIQDALVAKGYLQPEEATGKWDGTSIEAMKRFQAEQKLDSTGKINSLSLIALGLGPKYDSTASSKPAESPNGQR